MNILSAQMEDVVKAVEAMNILSKMTSPLKEDCFKKLASFSRYVTPCPDILDGAFDKEERTHKASSCSMPDCTCHNIDSADSSDDSSWESVKYQPSSKERQWKNLMEYEKSLLTKQRNEYQPSIQQKANFQSNNLSVPSSTPHQKTPKEIDSGMSGENVVKTLNSIAESLHKLDAQRFDNSADKFGKYIAQRLLEMPEENRAAAEIEINQVLMKYVVKQFEDSPNDGSSEDSDGNIDYRIWKKKQIIN